MSLKPGTQLGTYEILALLGAGGMGEVYRARDPKLNRLVAIKVLPPALAADQGLLARFDREAKAVAALSHPNVLGIFDLATEGGLTYAVMELLEGETLRDKLKGGALLPKRALEIATELAQGLGAAHERGIVHRDVKPENIFLTAEGRVKVLDFGLAKLTTPARSGVSVLDTEALSLTPNGTEAGMVLGTAGYMSPEQVKGEPADHRADIFSFGVVLYEMLSGHRPFKGETAHHTLTAILDQDPPPLVAARGPLPPALEKLVAHCLEKNPKARFQSMHDLAYDLQNLSTANSGTQVPSERPKRRAPWLLPAGATLAAVLVLLGAAALGDLLHVGRLTPPSFTRLTHTPGTIDAACFGPDGRTVYYSERIQGAPPELFVLHPDASEPKPLGVKDALLMGVSASGTLAVLHRPDAFFGSTVHGMLAQVDSGGGTLKEIREDVVNAAWDGTGFAIETAYQSEKIKLAFGGRTLKEENASTSILRYLRCSPDGATLALVEADQLKAELVTYDRAGRRTVRFTKIGDGQGDTLTGLAWGPGGDLWFSELQGDQTVLWSVSAHGSRHLLWRGQGTQALMDVSRDGRVLLAEQQDRRGVVVQRPGEALGRDVSIASGTEARGFSADGRSLLLLETPILDGLTAQDQTFLWNQDSGSSVRIIAGTGQSMSPDGRWVFLQVYGIALKDLDPAVTAAIREAGLDPSAVLDPVHPAPCLIFVPTGAGQPFVVRLPSTLGIIGYAFLAADDRHILFQGEEHGVSNLYALDRQGGAPKVLTTPDWGIFYSGVLVFAPDGASFFACGDDQFAVQSMAGGPPRPIPGLLKGERPMSWGQDPKTIFIRNTTLPLVISRLDLTTGARTRVYTYQPADATGLLRIRTAFTTPDARIFAFSYVRRNSDLYLVEGVN